MSSDPGGFRHNIIVCYCNRCQFDIELTQTTKCECCHCRKMPNVASTQFNQSPGVSAPGSGRGFNPCYSPIQGVVEGRVNGTAASVCGSDDGSVHSEGRRRAKRHQKPIGPCCVCKTAKGQFLSPVFKWLSC